MVTNRFTSFRFLLLSLAFVMFVPVVRGNDGSGMKVSASVDIVGEYDVDDGKHSDDRLDVREAEVMFYGPVDHIFDGMLSIAAHREDGVSLFEIHEANISTSKLIPRSSVKVGQYFLGVGRLNRFHRHEWPFVSAPKSHEVFFGSEGVLDTGLEYTYLMPLPFYLDITAGVTNGWVYGHAHHEGEKPKTPTHYTRVGTYVSAGETGGAQLGLNYVGRKSSDGLQTTLTGVDLVAKWRDGAVVDWLLQGELWHRVVAPEKGDKEGALGGYLHIQKALDSKTFLGLRSDYYSILTLKDSLGNDVKNADYGFVPTVSYKASEFSLLRLAYNHQISQKDDSKTQIQRSVELQGNFILGAHPAHDF